MIKYALKCSQGHVFESWFRDSEAFDGLAAAGQLTCPVCGDTKIEKSIMAPAVGSGGGAVDRPLSAPAHPAEAALKKLRAHLEKNADYVGRDFANEARRIHEGEADARHIWGEASVAEAKSLSEDGVPVAPLPFPTKRND
ncbi:MAG: DUF1178 family protein [Pseudomonadota bacterium]